MNRTLALLKTLALFITTLAGLLAATNCSFAQDRVIDYAKDIQPILSSNCYGCHNTNQQHGDLRLDQKAWAKRGGLSGGTILGGTVKNNLLYSRITSEDEELRMPLGEPRLSENDIETIRLWIEQGSIWPNSQQPALTWEQWLLEEFPRFRVQAAFVFGFLLLYLFLSRAYKKKQTEQTQTSRNWLGILCLAAIVATLFWGAMQEIWSLNQQNARLKEQLQDFREPTDLPDAKQPIAPVHPKRLRGSYYRGNDERNVKLFNGGFYRTCSFHISLRNKEGEILDYGSEVKPDEMFAHVEIERAPFAKEGLFTNPIMEGSCLINRRDSERENAVSFSTIEQYDRWEASLVLTPDSKLKSETDYRFSGVIELFRAKPHYSLHYNIRVIDGKIAESSDLRMVCNYIIGTIVRRPSGLVLENEWFSAREIPVIVGGNTDDPDLIGITEHIDLGLIKKPDGEKLDDNQ